MSCASAAAEAVTGYAAVLANREGVAGTKKRALDAVSFINGRSAREQVELSGPPNKRAPTVGPVRIAVQEPLDVVEARRLAREAAGDLGFSSKDCLEIAIVVSELGTNIVKYGIRGEVTVEVVNDPDQGVGLCITARDEGPPLKDFATALLDGHGDHGPIDPGHLMGRGGIGAGFGAIIRFTDTLEYLEDAGAKAFRVRRYRRRPARQGRLPCDPPTTDEES